MQDYTSYDIHTHNLHYIIVLMEKSCDVHTHEFMVSVCQLHIGMQYFFKNHIFFHRQFFKMFAYCQWPLLMLTLISPFKPHVHHCKYQGISTWYIACFNWGHCILYEACIAFSVVVSSLVVSHNSRTSIYTHSTPILSINTYFIGA